MIYYEDLWNGIYAFPLHIFLYYFIILWCQHFRCIWSYHRRCCWHFVLFSCVTHVFVSPVSLTFTLLLAFCPFLLYYTRVCFSGLSNVYLIYCCFNVPECFSYWKMWELCLVHKYDGVIVQNMLILKPQNEYKEELISVKSSSYSIVFNVTI
jgi:hypothetical protein